MVVTPSQPEFHAGEQPHADGLFTYRSHNGLFAHCDLRIYARSQSLQNSDGRQTETRLAETRLAETRLVVVMTERPDNPGTSVTNAVTVIASDVCASYRLDPRHLVWIEHYPARRGRVSDDRVNDQEPASFDIVTFKVIERAPAICGAFAYVFAGPHWTRLNQAQLETLIGVKWEAADYEGDNHE